MTNDQTQPIRYHEPVLINEVLEGLNVREGGRYIDATIGDGGHSKGIMDRGGVVLGIDQDKEAIVRVSERLSTEIEKGNLRVMQGNFSHIGDIVRENGFNQVDGVLFDLGMSSYQIEESGRGFTFQKDEPLDMRMDRDLSVTAADLVNALGKRELTELFRRFGQVERAPLVAGKIVEERTRRPIVTTTQLVDLVSRVNPRRGRLHPATKVFMALRLAVNNELGNLELALPQALSLLRPAGRLAAISFHEGEDRIVKGFFRRESGRIDEIRPSPMQPTEEEIARSPGSRSARLRIGVTRAFAERHVLGSVDECEAISASAGCRPTTVIGATGLSPWGSTKGAN